MNVKTLVVGLSLSTLFACGPGGETKPCEGDSCLDVAGTYTVEVQSPAAGNSCKRIHYSAGEEFSLKFTLTQNGSELEYHIGAGLEYTMPGTLFDNATAVFKTHLDHIVVRGSPDYDYADDIDASFSFSPQGDTMLISGNLSDGLTANADPVPGDEACFLNMSINGQR